MLFLCFYHVVFFCLLGKGNLILSQWRRMYRFYSNFVLGRKIKNLLTQNPQLKSE